MWKWKEYSFEKNTGYVKYDREQQSQAKVWIFSYVYLGQADREQSSVSRSVDGTSSNDNHLYTNDRHMDSAFK
jgi:hypothetical protein